MMVTELDPNPGPFCAADCCMTSGMIHSLSDLQSLLSAASQCAGRIIAGTMHNAHLAQCLALRKPSVNFSYLKKLAIGQRLACLIKHKALLSRIF